MARFPKKRIEQLLVAADAAQNAQARGAVLEEIAIVLFLYCPGRCVR